MQEFSSFSRDDDAIKARLSKIQTAIQKATSAASSQYSSSPRAVAIHQDRADPADATTASFHLGMDLFGADLAVVERQMRDKLDELESELQRVLHMPNDDDRAPEEPNAPSDPSEIDAMVEDYKHKIQFLKEASLVRTALEEATTLSSAALSTDPNLSQASQQLVQAMQHLDQARELMTASRRLEERKVASEIVESLNHSIRRQRIELLHRACKTLDSSIEISAHHLSAKSSTQVEEAFGVLEALEGGPLALEDTLRRLTRRLFDQALEPLLEPFRKPSPETQDLTPHRVHVQEDQPTKRMIGVSTSTKKGMLYRIEWHRSEEDAMPTDTITTSTTDDTSKSSLAWPVEVWKDTLNTMQKILAFLSKRILLERPTSCDLVGRKLFGKPSALPSHLHLNALGLESTLLGDDHGLLMEPLVELMAKTCLPDQLNASELTLTLAARGKELLDVGTSFCQALVDCKFAKSLEDNSKLLDLLQNFETNYVEHRRCVIINQGRDILKYRDYHNTVTIGVDEDTEDSGLSIFLLLKSSVSDVAFQMMRLIRETMTESVEMPPTPPTLRPTLYKAARELLGLFRAIIPARYRQEIATVPRTAAVFYNDCVYLAHHCLILGLEYKEKYPEDDARGRMLKQSCIFVDHVPIFRELADESLGDMLDLHGNELGQIVGQRIPYLGRALASHESLHEWSEAEAALAAGVYHLRHLSQSWKPTLSERIFCQSIGHLCDVVLALFGNQIMAAKSISSNARHFLLGLFRKASGDLKELFPTHPKPDRCLEDCSNEWNRFQVLVLFLDMTQLQQVEAALGSGVFRQVAVPELSHWIQATFVESAERRVLLRRLAEI